MIVLLNSTYVYQQTYFVEIHEYGIMQIMSKTAHSVVELSRFAQDGNLRNFVEGCSSINKYRYRGILDDGIYLSVCKYTANKY